MDEEFLDELPRKKAQEKVDEEELQRKIILCKRNPNRWLLIGTYPDLTYYYILRRRASKEDYLTVSYRKRFGLIHIYMKWDE